MDENTDRIKCPKELDASVFGIFPGRFGHHCSELEKALVKEAPNANATTPKEVKRNDALKDIWKLDRAKNWLHANGNLVNYFRLDWRSNEFEDVYHRFCSTLNRPHVIIDQIERVENDHLWGAFLLREHEFPLVHNINGVRKVYFHATNRENIHGICTHNFDWRKCKRNMFGNGVYFGKDAYIASLYCDQKSYYKHILVVIVLLGGTIRGNKDTLVPLRHFDATRCRRNKEVVKYYDNEFYPLYIITFHY